MTPWSAGPTAGLSTGMIEISSTFTDVRCDTTPWRCAESRTTPTRRVLPSLGWSKVKSSSSGRSSRALARPLMTISKVVGSDMAGSGAVGPAGWTLRWGQAAHGDEPGCVQASFVIYFCQDRNY